MCPSLAPFGGEGWGRGRGGEHSPAPQVGPRGALLRSSRAAARREPRSTCTRGGPGGRGPRALGGNGRRPGIGGWRRQRAGMRSGAEEVAMAGGGGGTAVYLQLGQLGGAGGGGARGACGGSSCRSTMPELPSGQPPRAAGAPVGEDARRPGEARTAAAAAARWC